MFCWHKWEKWSYPANAVIAEDIDCIGYFVVAQYRVCEKCGKTQYRKCPQIRSLRGLKHEKNG